VAVALVFLGAEMPLRRRRRRELQLSSHQKFPSTSASTLGDAYSPAELIEHNQVNRGGGCAGEVPAGEVAKEMDTRP